MGRLLFPLVVFVTVLSVVRHVHTQLVEPDFDPEPADCENTKPAIANADNKCFEKKCDVKCHDGYAFPNGKTEIAMSCIREQWIVEQTRETTHPPCRPVCTPKCENKGTCAAPNQCKCTAKYRGPQCQYSVENCASKLRFNGITTCQDVQNIYSCSLSCPPEMEFKVQPAPKYTCRYDEGTFEPQSVPQCHPRTKSCTAFGDPHYKTFDGKRYDFMGRCSYYLMNTSVLSVEAENVGCFGTILVPTDLPLLPACTKSVTVNIYGYALKLGQKHTVTVDGQIINKLPFKVTDDVTIRRVSSEYLQVDLPHGIKVLWNSNTIATIHVPETLRTDLKNEIAGLCGTLNNNPDDDFTTPEGSIEKNPVVFGNRWKTLTSCGDEPPTLPPPPCVKNKKNKTKAERYCKVLTSDNFKDCHWKVNPDSYYQDCLYDLCSCHGDYSACLCPVVEAYADECAFNGIKIDWKGTVKGCKTRCPRGQTYQVCGNPCTRSCADLIDANCQRQCVPGCNCPEGKALDETGKCVPITECKVPPQIECDATEKKEFTQCVQKELVTCRHQHHRSTTTSCYLGCKCQSGYVLDVPKDKCVLPSECSCQEGDVKNDDCNTCKCHNGKWKCSEQQCRAECSVWGESHYKTFDGKHYDFQGQCDYILAQGQFEDAFFKVIVQSIPCGTLGTTCSKSITINVKSRGDQDSITLTRDQPLLQQATLKHIKLRKIGNFVIIEAEELGLVIRWDMGTSVYVKVDSRWKHRVSGLCGDYNNNEADDFRTSTSEIGNSIMDFGDSWKIHADCRPPEEVTNPCQQRPYRKTWAIDKCSVLTSPVFVPCHDKVPVDIYLEKCIFDACACDEGGDCECLCTAIAAYAQECSNKGVHIKWREQKLCPLQCDEFTRYVPCISTCPVETCHNFKYFKNKCEENTCVEGCARQPCPPDHIYYNSSSSVCVPKTKCISPECELEPFKLHPSNCSIYYVCKQTPGGSDYVEQTCYNEYFNPNSGKCDQKIIVEELRPECKVNPCGTRIPITCKNGEKLITIFDKYGCPIYNCEPGTPTDETPTPTEPVTVVTAPIPCDMLYPIISHEYNCSKYYLCEITENGQVYIEKSCSSNEYYDTAIKECNRQDIVIQSRPECVPVLTPGPPPCDILNPYTKHDYNCSKYYVCEDTPHGPRKFEKICDPFQYFNPDTRACDQQSIVEKLRPECKVNPCGTRIPITCMHGEKLITISDEFGCPTYKCEPAKEQGRTPRPTEPVTVVTEPIPCDMLYPTISHEYNCSKYYLCKITENGQVYIEKSCSPNEYYDPAIKKCNRQDIVIQSRPECAPVPTPGPPPCDILNPYTKHDYNCSKYYVCEDTPHGPRKFERVCDPFQYFNPDTIACEPQSIVEKLRPECNAIPPGPTKVPCKSLIPIKCDYGERRTIRYDRNNCPTYECVCKLPEDCEPLQPIQGHLEEGYVTKIDNSGCCPRWVLTCEPSNCLPRALCPQHYERVIPDSEKDKCCPTYACHLPSDKCLYRKKFISAEYGGETGKIDGDHNEVWIDVNKPYNDGPCRRCICVISNTGERSVECEQTSCPATNVNDVHYVLEKRVLPNECCPHYVRTGCKHDGLEYKVGDTWSEEGDPCTIYKCMETDGIVEKIMQKIRCDDNCKFGSYYVPAPKESEKCCGVCTSDLCVLNGILYRVGQRWHSEDNCITYACVEDKGVTQLQAQNVSCPEAPSDEDDYVYETYNNGCCRRYVRTACKVNGQIYQEGQVVHYPEGDRCINVHCTRNGRNEIFKRIVDSICNTTCPEGTEYRPSSTDCCGQCVPNACIYEGEVKQQFEEWVFEKQCYTCELSNNQYSVIPKKFTCEVSPECPLENIYYDGCCKRCNFIPPRGNRNCYAEEMQLPKTVRKIKIIDFKYGNCTNEYPIENFTTCVGNCAMTYFDNETGYYDNDCSCCHGKDFKTLKVDLQCTSGFTMTRTVSVPSECVCNRKCSGNSKSHKYTKSHVKTGS